MDVADRRSWLTLIMFGWTLAACGGADGEAADEDQADTGGTRDGSADAAGSGPAGSSGGAAAGGAGSGGSSATGGSGAGGMAASGGTGGIAASGGTSGNEPALTNPLPGAYGTRTMMLEPNSEMAVAALDGKVYVLGGYPSDRTTKNTLQIYDIADDSWSRGKPCPIALHHPVLVAAAGKLYSLGGQVDGAMPDTNRVFSYDPKTDAWQEKATMPTARGGGAGAAIDNNIYVVGGRPPAANAFEVYDVATDVWATLPKLPTALNNRNHLAAAAIGGKIYVAGGRYNGGGFSSPITDALDVYDPTKGAWAKAKPMLRARGGVYGVAAFGCFHVIGGEATQTGEPNDVFPDHDVYDPRTDTWRALPRLPVPFHGVTGGAFSNGIIFMPGGGTQSGGTSGSRMHQVFRPDMRCDGM